MRPSLWVDVRREATPNLVEAVAVDVAVVGAGITGLTAALELARSGCRVAVLESRRLGSGATGYTTAKVSVLHGAHYRVLARDHGNEATAAYAAANVDGADWIRSRVTDDGLDCSYEARTALTWAHRPDAMADLEAEAAAAEAAGLPVRLVSDTDLPFPVAGGVELPEQAQFHPVGYLNGLAGLCEAAGVILHERTRVTSVSAEGDGGPIRVSTPSADVSADHVLVCTGIPFVDRGLFFARLEPVRSYVVAVPAPPGTPRSMSIAIDDPVRSLRTATGRDEDEVLLVGGESHVVGRRQDTDGAYDALVDWSRAVLGTGEPVASWSTQDYVTPDGLPYVGTTWSLPDRVQVATGFAKWGMTNGTAAGRMLASNVLGKPMPWTETFAAGRWGPARGLAEVARINAGVGGHFVRGHLKAPTTRPEPDDGEGVVVREGLHLTAVSRSQGATCAVSGVCPHLGGVVAWNPAEASWDCPLHGSRFDPQGELLQGPSVRDLPPRP